MFVLFVLSLFPISQDISEATFYGPSCRANLCLFVLESAIQSSPTNLTSEFEPFKLANPVWPCHQSMAIPWLHCLFYMELQASSSALNLLLFAILMFPHKWSDLSVTWNFSHSWLILAWAGQALGFHRAISTANSSYGLTEIHGGAARSQMKWALAFTIDAVIWSTMTVIQSMFMKVKVGKNGPEDEAKAGNSKL